MKSQLFATSGRQKIALSCCDKNRLCKRAYRKIRMTCILHTFFFQELPCKLNSPTFLLDLLEADKFGSFIPHLDLLSNSSVLLSRFPVIGIFPNRWSLLIAFLKAGEFLSFALAESFEFEISR